MDLQSPESENNGIDILKENDKRVYSVGISTAGIAEIRMALKSPGCHIIATTLDVEGASFAKRQISEKGFSKQIEVKIEDVTKPLPYPDEHFDYIYARLVLHYLDKENLKTALVELHRILKPNGKIFVVVRSKECAEAKDKSSVYNSMTHMTTYFSNEKVYMRYFHSEESIRNYLISVGFVIKNICSYKERIFVDFERKIPFKQIDTLLEVLAIK